jgi:hypothetical protein
MSYSVATLRSESAMIGKLTRVFCVSLMSSIHFLCDSTGSTDSAMTLTLRLANSSLSLAVSRAQWHTGVIGGMREQDANRCRALVQRDRASLDS